MNTVFNKDYFKNRNGNDDKRMVYKTNLKWTSKFVENNITNIEKNYIMEWRFQTMQKMLQKRMV